MCLWYSGGRWIRWVCLCTRVCLCVCACMCVWEYVPESIVISQIIWLHRLDLAPRRDGTFTVFHIYNICSVGGMCSRSHTSLAPCYKTATSVVYYLVIDTENDVALQLYSLNVLTFYIMFIQILFIIHSSFLVENETENPTTSAFQQLLLLIFYTVNCVPKIKKK